MALKVSEAVASLIRYSLTNLLLHGVKLGPDTI